MPDINAVRDMLPGIHDTVWLNTGTCGPLPKVAYDAMVGELQRDLTRARIDATHFPRIGETKSQVRAAVAQALGADPSEIAVTASTTDGMYAAIMGYRWQPGDELLTTSIEHPGGLIPAFIARRRFNLRVRVVDLGLGGDPAEIVRTFERAITPRTRMIVLSHVSYTTGARLPLKQIVELAHSRDVLVVADAAQTYGALPLDMRDLGVDIYACSGQKWMCGPDGTGALYVRADRVGDFEQTFVSSAATIRETLDYYGGSIAPAFGAARFDTAGRSIPLMLGQIAATRWITEDLGMDWVAERISSIASHAYDELARLPGLTIVTPREALAGLIAFNVEGIGGPELTRRLADEHNVTVRHVQKYVTNPDAARASFGFFNTEEDVERLVAGIRTIQKTR